MVLGAKKTVSLLFLILVFGVILRYNNVDITKAAVSPISPDMIHVPGNFSTIQAAINDATPGDTILVANGTYKEQITINKPLNLVGENRSNTIIDASSGTYVVRVTSSNITISGFTIRNATDSDGWGGVWLNGFSSVVTNVTVTNCTVTKCLYAVGFTLTQNNTFRENEFSDNLYDFGFTGEAPRYFAQNIDASNKVNGKPVYWWVKQHDLTVPSDAGMVAAVNCTNITVENLTLAHNGRSVMLVNTNNSLVENVTASNDIAGIFLSYSHNNTISNNTVFNVTQFGIALTRSNENAIHHNNASYCGYNLKLVTSHQNKITTNALTHATDYHGLVLDAGCLYNTISDNIVSFNKNGGIALDDNSDWNAFTHNFMEGNMGSFGGIDLFDGSSDNIITKNTFLNNSIGVRTASGGDNTDTCRGTIYKNSFINNQIQTVHDQYTKNHTWDNGAEGNYWSNYSGVDLNRDGIGDTPYIMDLDNKDNYPLMKPFLEGDCNHDGIVNIKDATLIGIAWDTTKGAQGFNPHADLNMDDVINMADAEIIRENWQKRT